MPPRAQRPAWRAAAAAALLVSVALASEEPPTDDAAGPITVAALLQEPAQRLRSAGAKARSSAGDETERGLEVSSHSSEHDSSDVEDTLGCLDTNGHAMDKHDEGCSWYETAFEKCSSFDDSDFSAGVMCCACRGGVEDETELHSLDEEGQHHGNSLHEVHDWALYVMLPITAAFMVALLCGSQLHRHHIDCIPESAGTIFVGICSGLLLKNLYGITEIDEELFGAINSTTLNLILLPVIIFESGWSVRRHDLASQIVYILIFAIIGTVISVLVVALIIFFTSHWHHISSLRVAFAYASLISAVDPVATLATYASLQVEPLLNIMVFGESVINDAVAIVLFHVLNDDSIWDPPQRIQEDVYDNHTAMEHIYDQFVHIHGAEKEHKTVPTISRLITFQVLKLLFGSIFLGFSMGVGYVLILKATKMQKAVTLQILFIFVSCFLTYSLAEGVHMSGIIAVLFCSVIMSIYAKPHLSIEGTALASFFLKNVAMLADMAVFMFVGAAVVMLEGGHLLFSLIVMMACLVGRLCAVFPLGALVNCIKKCRFRNENKPLHPLTFRHLFMMWHAGLRGGIAFVLCMELGDWVDLTDGPGTKKELRTATFITVCVFLLLFGGSTKFTLKAAGIPCGEQVAHEVLYRSEYTRSTRRGLLWLHESILKPLLVGDVPLRASHHEEGIIIGAIVAEASNLQGRPMISDNLGGFLQSPIHEHELESASENGSEAEYEQQPFGCCGGDEMVDAEEMSEFSDMSKTSEAWEK